MNNRFYYLNRISIVFIFIILIHTSCNNPSTTRTQPDVQTDNKIVKKEFTTKSGKIFVLTEDKSLGESISLVKLDTKNFEIANVEFKLGEIDPIVDVFLADLDQNGFEECYIISQSVGSGTYGTIFGFASNNDKSISPIYFPEISENDLKSGATYHGYRGHNSFNRVNNLIINSFPVYKEEDTNANPTGGTRKVKYELIAGESGWILKPAGIIP